MTLPAAHVAATFGLLELLPPLLAAGLYAKRASTLAGRGRPVPIWRQVCFAAGLALIGAALFSPLGHLSGELLLAHMAEHLLIADIAAILLVLGLTGPVIQPLLAIGAIDRLRVLAHPAVAFPLWAVNLYLWHLPSLYQATLHNEALHALEHTLFIGFGCLMWLPLLGPLPIPSWFGNGAKLIYTVVVRLTGAVLANVFMWANTVFYPDYAPGEAYWDISPIADQSTAGVIMMVEGSLVTLGVFAWLFFRAAAQQSESQRLRELAEEQGVELEEGRAERAVAAGQGKRLEERLSRR